MGTMVMLQKLKIMMLGLKVNPKWGEGETFYFSIFVVVAVYIQSQRICQHILANHVSRPRTPYVDGSFTAVKDCSERHALIARAVFSRPRGSQRKKR